MDLLEKNTQDLSKLADAVNDMRSSLTILNHDMKLTNESLKHFEPYIEKIKKLETLMKVVVFAGPVFTAIISGWLGYDVGLYQLAHQESPPAATASPHALNKNKPAL